MPRSDTVVRGGDEFVIVLGDLPDSDEAGRVAAKIVAELARALVQQADAAMCRTKQSGRGRIVVAGA